LSWAGSDHGIGISEQKLLKAIIDDGVSTEALKLDHAKRSEISNVKAWLEKSVAAR
jgi:hypothetical protein